MAEKIRVCILLEGSYPYITGGVSAWVQDIIQGLPHVEFVLMTISPLPDQKLRYILPANVVEHTDIVLGRKNTRRQGPQVPWQKVPWKQGLKERKRAIASVMAAHKKMFSNEMPDLGTMFSLIPEGYDLTEDAVRDDRAWKLIIAKNRENNPVYAFSEYLWAWKSAHGMLFDAMGAIPPQADIYHAISTGFAGLAAVAARERYGKPFLLSEHGLYHKEREIEIRKSSYVKGYQRDMWIKTYNRISKICYGKADRITALFEENRQKQMELGAPPHNCQVIPNGIDIERFSSVKRSPRPGYHVGLVGRIVPIKDIKTFIATAKIVLDRLPDAIFYAIGPTDEDPEYYDDCVALTKSLKIADRFLYTGRQNVLEYYSFLDLMLLTSIREAQPLVIMEAWAAGVPSVSTKVGNVPEMLDFDERFLAPSKSPEKLASCVIYAHDHPEEMALINERNRKKAFTQYDKKTMLASYTKLYESMKDIKILRGQP